MARFAKLRNATISITMYVLSAWNNWSPTGRIFMKFGVLIIFRKSVDKTQDSLKSDENNG